MLTPLTLLLVISQLHQVLNTPLYKRASDIKTPNDLPILITSHPHHIQQIIKPARQKKGHSIPVIPIPHHLLVPANLHVIPAQSNVQHRTVHTNVNLITKDNVKIPVVTQTVSHSTTNVTHPAPLYPILIPIHHNLVQLHDLSVIPLQSSGHKVEKLGQFREEKKEEDHEEQNRYRTYYGGFGSGLFFGGHGAGHGFYHAYGK